MVRYSITVDQSVIGTLLNNRLIHGDFAKLFKGDLLQFSSVPGYVYEFINDEKPVDYLVDEKNTEHIFVKDDFLELVDNQQTYMLYWVSEDLWCIEDGDTTKKLSDGTEIIFKDRKWTYHKNTLQDFTIPSENFLPEPRFVFEVSPSYEHVSIHIKVNGGEVVLPPKAMNYTLYLLAKQAETDLKTGTLAATEIGWIDNLQLVDQLQKELLNDAIDIYYLNVQICRLRKAFAKTEYGKVLNSLIERRSGQIRFKHSDFEIKEHALSAE